MDSRIYIAYGSEAKDSTLLLMETADVISRIPSGAPVALKPNLVVARPADGGATTHPGVIEGALEYLADHGVKDVSIIEGSWVGDSTSRAYQVLGYDRIAARFGVKLYDLKQDSTEAVDTPIGKIKICERALNVGYLINLPVLKGHCQTVMTCALKNLKGCIPDSEKRRFHTLGLHKPIAALAAVLARNPLLTIADGICGDLSFEEGGTPIQTNRMLLGEDMVKLDTLGCRLMGIDPDEVQYIGLAERWGAGSRALTEADVIQIGDPRKAEAFPKPSGKVARLSKGVVQKDACSACYGNLIHALYRLDEQGALNYLPDIAIGQGMRGDSFHGVGIGRCCDCADVIVPGCPPTPEDILHVLTEQRNK